jgi:hypothetical protein
MDRYNQKIIYLQEAVNQTKYEIESEKNKINKTKNLALFLGLIFLGISIFSNLPFFITLFFTIFIHLFFYPFSYDVFDYLKRVKTSLYKKEKDLETILYNDLVFYTDELYKIEKEAKGFDKLVKTMLAISILLTFLIKYF